MFSFTFLLISSDETSISREIILQNNPVEKQQQQARTLSNITETTGVVSSGSSTGSSGYHHNDSNENSEEDEWFYINKGDIFQVTHTHYKRSKKKWRATKIFEPHRILNDKIIKMGSGVIPSGQNFYYSANEKKNILGIWSRK